MFNGEFLEYPFIIVLDRNYFEVIHHAVFGANLKKSTFFVFGEASEIPSRYRPTVVQLS